MKKFFSLLMPFVLLLTAMAFVACPTDTDPGTDTPPGQSVMPIIGQTTVAKTSSTQNKVAFTITGAAPAAGAVFKVYEDGTAAAEHAAVEAEFSAEGGSFLVLKAAADVPAGAYYVSVTEAPKTESMRVALTVAAAGVSVMPTISPVTVTKTASVQNAVMFPITGSAPAANAVFKVYADNTTNTVHGAVTAEFRELGSVLILRHAADVPADAYYVTVTEALKTESTRVALTVEGQAVIGTTEVTFHRTLGYFPYEIDPFGTATRYVSASITAEDAPVPVRPGFTFAGWYSQQSSAAGADNGNGAGDHIVVGPVGIGTPITGPRTVYAKWQWAVPFTRLEYAVNEAGTAFTGTFYDANGNKTGNTHNATLSGSAITDEKGYKVVSINQANGYIKLHEIAASPFNGGSPNPLYTSNGVGWTVEIYYYQPDVTTNFNLLDFSRANSTDTTTAGRLWVESYSGVIRRSTAASGTAATTNSMNVRNTWANVVYVCSGNWINTILNYNRSPASNNGASIAAPLLTSDYAPLVHNYIGRGMNGGKIYKVIIHSNRRGLDGNDSVFPSGERTVMEGVIAHLNTAVGAAFDPLGGNWNGNTNPRTIYRIAGTAFGSLFPAEPVKNEEYFWGWNTVSDGSGTWISAATVMPSSATTYYAVWKNEPATYFDITLPTAGSVNAAITADKAQARVGDAVTVTVTPPARLYRLASLKYAETGNAGDPGADIFTVGSTVIRDERSYDFTMPAYNVTVTAEFVLLSPLVVNTMGESAIRTGDLSRTPIATGWWNGFNDSGAVFMSNGAQDPANSGVAQYQQNFTTLSGSVISGSSAPYTGNELVDRSRVIGVARSSGTPAANQRWGRTFPGGSAGAQDYSGYNRISFYLRSMYPLNTYYFALCNGGVLNTSQVVTEAVIGTQYRKEFSVLDYVNKYNNGDSVGVPWGNSGAITPKWMKIVINLDELTGPAGSDPFNPAAVTGWVFGFAGSGAFIPSGQEATASTADSGAALQYNNNGSSQYYRAERTYLNWIVLEAVEE